MTKPIARWEDTAIYNIISINRFSRTRLFNTHFSHTHTQKTKNKQAHNICVNLWCRRINNKRLREYEPSRFAFNCRSEIEWKQPISPVLCATISQLQLLHTCVCVCVFLSVCCSSNRENVSKATHTLWAIIVHLFVSNLIKFRQIFWHTNKKHNFTKNIFDKNRCYRAL